MYGKMLWSGSENSRLGRGFKKENGMREIFRVLLIIVVVVDGF